MATVDITQRFLNQDKTEAEGVVVTIPSVLNGGGGRSNALPSYIQGGDALTAQVIEKDSLIKKAYIVVDEAFPAGALLNVDVAGTAFFTGIDGTVTGLVVSLEEDVFLANKQTVTVSVAGITGDVLTGKARVMFDMFHPLVKNGRYAN